MSHRQNKLVKTKRLKYFRPSVESRYSNNEPFKVKLDAAQPRLDVINDVLRPARFCDPKDVTLYTQGSSRVATQPPGRPAPKKKPAHSTFPSFMQSLYWCRNVGVASDEDIEPPDDDSFRCNCAKCAMKKCQAKKLTKCKCPFKDNIMTFNDQNTMTSKLKDASCICANESAPSKAATSDVSISGSNITVKDTACEPELSQPCSYDPCHMPKKQSHTLRYHSQQTDFPEVNYAQAKFAGGQIPVRCIKPYSRQQKEYPPPTSRMGPRINIYNEGISDRVADNLPDSSYNIPESVKIRVARNPGLNIPRPSLDLLPPACARPARSRVLVKTRSVNETDIPFSHRPGSKYHATCKLSTHRKFYEFHCDDMNYLVDKPKALRQACSGRHHHLPQQPNIRLPKRVLTSERNIESFVNKK